MVIRLIFQLFSEGGRGLLQLSFQAFHSNCGVETQ